MPTRQKVFYMVIFCIIIVSFGCGRISTEVDISAPSNLTATVTSDLIVKLDWIYNYINVYDSLRIERKKFSENYELLATLTCYDTTFVDTDIFNDVTYTYRLCSYNHSTQSEFSNEASATYHQDEIFVPEDYDSIQLAIDNTINGNTIWVHPGIYYENIDFIGKIFILTSTNGPESTIIDGAQNGRVITINSGENSTAVLCGFTIQNGSDTFGGGIICSSNIILNNLIIKDNSAEQGGGIYGSSTINNVIIFNNTADFWGGGIYCGWGETVMENVVVANNTAGTSFGCGIYSSSNTNILNSIIWGNLPQNLYGYPEEVFYSNVQDDWIGEGNINENPLFLDSENGNFYLQDESPCIDIGHPDLQYNDTDGTRNDMGAYGGPYGNW